MKILVEVSDSKAELFLEFIKNISFIEYFEKVTPNQVISPAILQSIEDYETGKVQPTPCSLADLKTLINA